MLPCQHSKLEKKDCEETDRHLVNNHNGTVWYKKVLLISGLVFQNFIQKTEFPEIRTTAFRTVFIQIQYMNDNRMAR